MRSVDVHVLQEELLVLHNCLFANFPDEPASRELFNRFLDHLLNHLHADRLRIRKMVSLTMMFGMRDQMANRFREPIDRHQVLSFVAAKSQQAEKAVAHQVRRKPVGHGMRHLKRQVKAMGRRCVT